MTACILDGIVRRYDWGSPTAIPQLLGMEPDGRPHAELWFGAHPDDPATVAVHGTTLADVIDRDPVRALGQRVVDRLGPRLPYLLKVLAADRALSLQVHPTREQAQAGYAAEDAAGIACDAANRNYRDSNHKPELLCAVTPFSALCGFRPVAATRALLDQLALPQLAFLTEALDGPDPLRAAFTAVLRHDEPAALSAAVAGRIAADRIAADQEPATEVDDPLAGVRLCAQDFPGDIGVVLALLFNSVRLEPGEAIYLGAGTVHAYLRGTGVEIMANSDNVLRCGLTPKHVDVDEVLAVTDFTPLAEPRWTSVGGTFQVPVPDFRLTRLDLDSPTGLDDDGPCLVLCISGDIQVGDDDVAPGRAAFVPAGEPTTIAGTGEVFIAGVGLF